MALATEHVKYQPCSLAHNQTYVQVSGEAYRMAASFKRLSQDGQDAWGSMKRAGRLMRAAREHLGGSDSFHKDGEAWLQGFILADLGLSRGPLSSYQAYISRGLEVTPDNIYVVGPEWQGSEDSATLRELDDWLAAMVRPGEPMPSFYENRPYVGSPMMLKAEPWLDWTSWNRLSSGIKTLARLGTHSAEVTGFTTGARLWVGQEEAEEYTVHIKRLGSPSDWTGMTVQFLEKGGIREALVALSPQEFHQLEIIEIGYHHIILDTLLTNHDLWRRLGLTTYLDL